MYPIGMSHTEIINRWPSLSAFASDLGIAYGTAKAMRRRGSIPPTYWPTMVAKAKTRKLSGITLEALAVAVAKSEAA